MVHHSVFLSLSLLPFRPSLFFFSFCSLFLLTLLARPECQHQWINDHDQSAPTKHSFDRAHAFLLFCLFLGGSRCVAAGLFLLEIIGTQKQGTKEGKQKVDVATSQLHTHSQVEVQAVWRERFREDISPPTWAALFS